MKCRPEPFCFRQKESTSKTVYFVRKKIRKTFVQSISDIVDRFDMFIHFSVSLFKWITFLLCTCIFVSVFIWETNVARDPLLCSKREYISLQVLSFSCIELHVVYLWDDYFQPIYMQFAQRNKNNRLLRHVHLTTWSQYLKLFLMPYDIVCVWSLKYCLFISIFS